jgi:hypothetical protein
VFGAADNGPGPPDPVGDEGCDDAMPAVVTRAIRSGIDEKVFISPPEEKLTT